MQNNFNLLCETKLKNTMDNIIKKLDKMDKTEQIEKLKITVNWTTK